jgi:hypothetical protein
LFFSGDTSTAKSVFAKLISVFRYCNPIFSINLNGNESKSSFDFVELKGKEIQKAYNQLVETIKYLNFLIIPPSMRFGFIVSSSIPKAGIGTNVQKQDFTKKLGRTFEVENIEMTFVPK